MRITAYEGVDDADIEPRRRADDFQQMADYLLAMLFVRMQRVRIVAEAGDLYAMLVDQIADAADFFVAETRDVDVRHAGVTPIGAARRPAHQLDAAKTLVGGEGQNLVEIHVGQDGADETELHRESQIVERRSTI